MTPEFREMVFRFPRTEEERQGDAAVAAAAAAKAAAGACACGVCALHVYCRC
jgi:hypothetical protein